MLWPAFAAAVVLPVFLFPSTLAQHRLSVGGAGRALRLDGLDDFVYLYGGLPRPPVTIELWVQLLELVDAQGETIVKHNPSAMLLSRNSARNGVNLFALANQGTQLWTEGGIHQLLSIEDPMQDGSVTHHIALTVDEHRNYKCYLNGTLVRDGTLLAGEMEATSAKLDDAFNWILGGRMAYVGGNFVLDDRCFGGLMDELRWWSKALSPEEIRHWMHIIPPPDEPGLHLRWSFDNPDTAEVVAPEGRFSEGGGDSIRAPAKVPSPMPLVGGVVAVDTYRGAQPTLAKICAAIWPAAPNASATASFEAWGNVGYLSLANGSSGDVVVELAPQNSDADNDRQNSTLLCGDVLYHPMVAGSGVFPFNISAFLPPSDGGGRRLFGTGRMEVRVADNLPPAAGLARAVETDGRTGYASLGVWELPSAEVDSNVSFSVWVKPKSLVDDSYILASHTAKGSNLFLFGWWNSRYAVMNFCRSGCNGGEYAEGTALFPPGDSNSVLPNGKTVGQVIAEVELPHLLTVTIHCHSRGNLDPVNTPARATVKMYVDGGSIGAIDINSCLHTPMLWKNEEADQPGLHAVPWEMSQEYDGDSRGTHLEGVFVKPSNFYAGIFDDVRFWKRELTEEDVQLLSAGGNVHEYDLIVRYTFDLDDPYLCQDRQLAEPHITCFGVNEASGRTRPSERYPWTNSLIGNARFVSSPFQQLTGSPVYRTMQVGTCAEIQLVGSDPNVDPLTFSLPSYPTGTQLLDGGKLRYCSPSEQDGPLVEVRVPFDACDPGGLCASAASGLGSVVFRVLQEGPWIRKFQVLPEHSSLRLFFSEPTDEPSVDSLAALHRLLTFEGLTLAPRDGPLRAEFLSGHWEAGSLALRIVLGQVGSPVPPAWMSALLHDPNGTARAQVTGMRAHLRQQGRLRDRSSRSFPSTAATPPVEVLVCGHTKVLPSDKMVCVGCPAGSYRDERSRSCQACMAGWHQPSEGHSACLRCPKGRFSDIEGALECRPCDGVLPGSTTDFLGSTSNASCMCPSGSAFSRATQDDDSPTCRTCTQGLLCLGGTRGRPQGVAEELFEDVQHQPPLQKAGYSIGKPPYEGGQPSFVVHCSSAALCPGGLELGTCPASMHGRACARCVQGFFHDGSRCTDCSELASLWTLLMPISIWLLVLGFASYKGLKGSKVFSSFTFMLAAAATTSLTTLQTLSVMSCIEIDWPMPLSAIGLLFQSLTLDVSVLRHECSFKNDNYLTGYLGSLAVYPVFAVQLTLLMFLASRFRGEKMRKDRFWNGHGFALMAMYTSIIVVAVVPFHCDGSNPDGSSSLVARRDVVCWRSKEHVTMIILSIIFFLCFPVVFLSVIGWATWSYPTRMTVPGSRGFLKRFMFLFDLYKTECYYYGFCFTVRKLLITLVTVIFVSTHLQIFFLLLLVSGGMALHCRLWPFRCDASNYFEVLVTTVLIMLVTTGLMLDDYEDFQSVEHAASSIVWASCMLGLALLVCFMFYCLYRAITPKRTYFAFLSHHKVGAQMLARWMKMILTQKGVGKIFLDSDDVTRLDKLVDIVSNDCYNVVILLTRETLNRPWCAMEIAAAHQAGTRLVPVVCGDFEGISKDFLDHLKDIWTHDELACMASAGIDVEFVVKAYLYLDSLPSIELNRQKADAIIHSLVADEIVDACHPGRTLAGTSAAVRKVASGGISALSTTASLFATVTNSGQLGRVRSSQTHRLGICILGDMSAVEVACTCRVVQLMLQASLQCTVVLAGEAGVGRCNLLVVLLSKGILADVNFAQVLVDADEDGFVLELVPLVTGEAFDFPCPTFWKQLHEGDIISHETLLKANLSAERVEAAYRRLFKMLAVRFSAHSSQGIQSAEIASISKRLKGLFKDRPRRPSPMKKAAQTSCGEHAAQDKTQCSKEGSDFRGPLPEPGSDWFEEEDEDGDLVMSF